MKKYVVYILIIAIFGVFFGTAHKASAAACQSGNLFLGSQGDIMWGDTVAAPSDVSATTGSSVRLSVSGEDGCAGQTVTFQIVGGATFQGTLSLGAKLNTSTPSKYQLYYDWTNNLPNGNYKFNVLLPFQSGASANTLKVGTTQSCSLSRVYANPNGGYQGTTVKLTTEAQGVCQGWKVTVNVINMDGKVVWSGAEQSFASTNQLVWDYVLPQVNSGAGQNTYSFDANLGTQTRRSSPFVVSCGNGTTCGTAPPPAPPTTPIDTRNYHFLAPLPCDGANCNNGQLTDFDAGQNNPLSAYLNTMIRILIGLAGVMSVVMIVVGGIEYMTSELVHNKESAKGRMTGAVFGLLIVMGAYALLYTINPEILNSDLSSLKIVTVQIDTDADVPQTYDPTSKKYPDGTTFGSKWDDSVGANTVLPPGITIKQPECTTVGQQDCTSRRRLNTSKVIEIHGGCGCDIVITGGTESWLHGGKTGNTTHKLDSSTVDLRTTTELDRYLSGGKPLVYMQRYPDKNGPYLYEGNHWHVGR